LSIFSVPLVLQYNKMDLKEAGVPLLSVETLQKDLNGKLRVPAFEASALSGGNVIASLKKIITLTMASIQEKLL